MSGTKNDRLPSSAKLSFLLSRVSLCGKLNANWIASRMSGWPICAITDPSAYSTMECMIDSGCTTTSIFSPGVPKSHLASMISSPLFIMVAESMVILLPMLQFGWLSACSLVALAICSRDHVLNGPPEAVRWIFSMSAPADPMRHWKIAECSESTGRIRAPCCAARSMTMAPAATSVSLFANAMVFPAFTAATVEARPLNPTMEVRTMSMLSPVTRSHTDFMPANTFI